MDPLRLTRSNGRTSRYKIAVFENLLFVLSTFMIE